MTMQVEAFGETHTIAEWAEITGIGTRSLYARLHEAGMPPEIALTLPHRARVDLAAPCGGPDSWTWILLPYEDDEWAQDFVVRHPRGATLEEVAAAMGVDKEAVRQVESQALRSLLRLGTAALRLLRQRFVNVDEDVDEDERMLNAIDARVREFESLQLAGGPAAETTESGASAEAQQEERAA